MQKVLGNLAPLLCAVDAETTMPLLPKKPRRLTVTVSDYVYQQLIGVADEHGRSLSNYAAYLLERAIERSHASPLELDGVVPISHLDALRGTVQQWASQRT